MAMRTAAKVTSRRLLSGARNFSEKAKPVENLHFNGMFDKTVEVANSGRTYPNIRMVILGFTCAMGGYFCHKYFLDEDGTSGSINSIHDSWASEKRFQSLEGSFELMVKRQERFESTMIQVEKELVNVKEALQEVKKKVEKKEEKKWFSWLWNH